MKIFSISTSRPEKNSIFQFRMRVVFLCLGVIGVGVGQVAFSAETFEDARSTSGVLKNEESLAKADLAKNKKKKSDAVLVAELSMPGEEEGGVENNRNKKKKDDSFKIAQLSRNLVAQYNTAFLYGAAPSVDMDFILRGDTVAEGEYLVDLYVNSIASIRENIIFSRNQATGLVEPCFNADVLRKIGLNFETLKEQNLDSNVDSCLRLSSIIPLSKAIYDQSQLRLNVSIPQAYMHEAKRGYVDPLLWSNGVPVVFVNYNFNASRNSGFGSSNNYASLTLNSGVNWGAWHFRNNSGVTRFSGQNERWSSQNTYLQRDLTGLKSQLWLGETYTRSDLFDSVRFLGVQIATDESMFPASEQGYAPVIRGTAETNATVEVRQDGYLLYSENVAPGPFVIRDLSPSGSNGNLEVVVIEADGRRKTTIEAFSRPPLMVREGRLKYAATAGRFKQARGRDDDPFFTSASAVYGLTSNVTVAGGLEMTSGYRSIAAGVGWNTKAGAISMEMAHARSSVDSGAKSGQSLRLAYAKFFQNTATNVTLSAQYSLSENYRSMADHIDSKNGGGGIGYIPRNNLRSRITASISQPLGGSDRNYGSFYVTANNYRYWNSGSSRNISVGYSKSFGQMGLSVNLNNIKNEFDSWGGSFSKNTNTLSVSLSMPLSIGDTSNINSNSTFTKTEDRNSFQTNVTGYLDDNKDFNYSLNAGHDSLSGTSSGVYIGAQTPYGTMSAGYNHSSHFKNFNAQANGSIVWHQYGVNVGQYVGESFALVKLDPPASGVKIAGANSKIETGYNGVAVVPTVVPYRHNWIGVNAAGAASDDGSDVEVNAGMVQVVPRRGAAVLAEFRSEVGRRVQFEFLLPDGAAIPFGAQVLNEQGHRLAMTDPRGRALTMVTGKAVDKGVLTVQWGTNECQLPYQLPEKAKGENYQRVKLTCSKIDEFVPQKALRMELALQE